MTPLVRVGEILALPRYPHQRGKLILGLEQIGVRPGRSGRINLAALGTLARTEIGPKSVRVAGS